ncbi:hypothetical protein LTR65_003144 [Meristemomyces frigidus]
MQAGQPESAVINGETVAAASGGIAFGSQTFALPQLTAQAGEITVSSQAFTVAPQPGDPSAVIVANGVSTITLTAGSAGGTLGGQAISAAQSGGVVIGTGSEAESVPSVQTSGQYLDPQQGVVTIGSQEVTTTAVSDGLVLGYGQTVATLSAGGAAITIGTQILSAGSSGQLLAGSSPLTLTPAQQSDAILTLGSSTITASGVPGQSDAIVIDGSTLSAGGPAQTISGQELSVGADGLVLGSSTTLPLARVTSIGPEEEVGTLLTLGQTTVTAYQVPGQSGEAVVGGSTLSDGGPAAIIEGQTVSEGSGGLVVGVSTTVSLPQITSVAAASGVLIMLGGSKVTATPVPGKTGEVVLDGTTLSVGGPAYTVSGEVVSEASDGLASKSDESDDFIRPAYV